MKCPICGSEMEKGEVCINGAGTLYWAPEDCSDKQWCKMMQLKHTIENEGGAVISREATNLSKTTASYHCRRCKKIIIDYE
ncbi:MAG: hypothetical protein GX424_08370 [Clostridiales bacterium]|nr:hypothetical protein [Clostridiales bacterium]